jgi:hypothetical protein
MEVIFQISKIYWTIPTNITKHVFLISSYLGHLPVMSSSMEVVFPILKNLKIVWGFTGIVLQMLQSMFCRFPAISLLSRVGVGWGKSKLKLTQPLNGAELGNIIYKAYCHYVE